MRAAFPSTILSVATRWSCRLCHVVAVLLVVGTASVRAADANSREDQVPPYSVPDVLQDPLEPTGSSRATTPEGWRSAVRPALRRLFEREVYGPPVPTVPELRWRVVAEESLEWGGSVGGVWRREVVLETGGGSGRRLLHGVVWLPRRAGGRAPVFVGMHLFDTAAPAPVPARPREAGADAAATGLAVGRRILERGYALASLDIGDLAPDSLAQFRSGVLSAAGFSRTGPTGDDEPGALAAWAWGLSRFLDYALQAPGLDGSRVIAIGHSRMGKAALWAGACDERFAAVISNNSGCGGAALNRRWFGETVGIITRAFPYWFGGRFRSYAGRESELAVDQHQLLALIAPRPLYVASAEADAWADPRGEYLALWHASPVWSLHGLPGLASSNSPPVDQPVGTVIRYHVRRGQHDLTDYDWDRYLDFADRQVLPGTSGSASR